MKQISIKLVLILIVSSFLGLPIRSFEPPKAAPKTEYEEMAELAEQFLQELKQEEEKKRVAVEEIAAQARRKKEEAEEREKELKEKAEIERKAREKKLKEEEEKRVCPAPLPKAPTPTPVISPSVPKLSPQMAQKPAEKIINTILESYITYKPIAIEYLSLKTLQELLQLIDQQLNDEQQIERLSKHFKLSTTVMLSHLYDLRKDVVAEIEKRKRKLTQGMEPSLKDLILNKDIDLNRLSLKRLDADIEAIEKIVQSEEFARWADELNTDLPQLGKILRDLKIRLRQTKLALITKFQEDLNKSNSERKEEEAALKRSGEFAKKIMPQEPPAKVKEISNKFPQFFENIPQEHQLAFLTNFEKRYAEGRSIEVALNDLYKKDSDIIQTQRLFALAGALGFSDSYYMAGYVYFVHKRPSTKPPILPEYLKIQQNLAEKKSPEERKRLQADLTLVAERLVQTYKVHLMPVDAIDQIKILLQMDKAIKADPELSSLITVFKILVNPYREGNVIFPKVVIYAFNKEDTQKILNRMYQQFKDIPGLDLQPRYNAKVNALIWIAQGDGDYKGDPYSSYYESPGRVYYRPDFTGKPQNYHLVHPETGKEII